MKNFTFVQSSFSAETMQSKPLDFRDLQDRFMQMREQAMHMQGKAQIPETQE